MITCPNCKETIDDRSFFCDQCGQALLYCSQCGRVGLGKRCTHCGNIMFNPQEATVQTATTMQAATGQTHAMPQMQQNTMPQMLLINNAMNMRIVASNGAIVGRRLGPYAQQLQTCMYVSGQHAQLTYSPTTGWCITDLHSSNGTTVNGRKLMPDTATPIRGGDMIGLANINLQVSISQ